MGRRVDAVRAKTNRRRRGRRRAVAVKRETGWIRAAVPRLSRLAVSCVERYRPDLVTADPDVFQFPLRQRLEPGDRGPVLAATPPGAGCVRSRAADQVGYPASMRVFRRICHGACPLNDRRRPSAAFPALPRISCRRQASATDSSSIPLCVRRNAAAASSRRGRGCRRDRRLNASRRPSGNSGASHG